ncbi:unnamed protein product [Tenebrio molitor]|nr:unnamed protein product [Tenebrio molitor]
MFHSDLKNKLYIDIDTEIRKINCIKKSNFLKMCHTYTLSAPMLCILKPFDQSYKSVSKSKIHQHCILPRKYNRQRCQLFVFSVFASVGKSGVMKENC